MNRILVIGSLNLDHVIEVKDTPKEGETILGKGRQLIPGGKGANQAYAAGRLGGTVSMIGAVGTDEAGKELIANLKKAGVNTEGIKVMEQCMTGQAYIAVNERGNNSIIVVQGANNLLNKEWVDENIHLIEACDIVIMQLEIPLDVVIYAAQIAKKKGKTVLLDPAPAPEKLPEELLRAVDILKPNETELATLTGMEVKEKADIELAAKMLIAQGAKILVVTLGEKGAMLVTKDTTEHFSSEKVKVVDTTAAGDSFTAALGIRFDPNRIGDAIRFGNKVSAIVVTRKGAQTSIPSLSEIV